MKYLLFLFPIFLQAQCLIETHSYRLVCADEVRYADSTSIGSRLYISSRNAFVTSPRSVFSLVNGYGQHFIQITNSANSQKVAINRAWINRIDSTSSNKALIYIKDISVTFTSTESYTAVKDSAIACFVRAVASGLATLSDGDYGDVIVSGGGLVMTVDKPDLGLHNLADGDFSVVADSTALSLTNVRTISLASKNIDGWISRYLQTNNSLTLRTNNSTKTSRIYVDTTGANFQFISNSNNASLRIGDSVAVRFNTSGSVGQVLTVTSIDGDGRLVINPKTGGSGTANCEQTLTKTAHGFRKWTPIYWNGSTWARPTYDSIIPTYIVIDSTTANTFKVANCGNYASTLTAGIYWYTSASPGYSLTPDTIKTPLFEVAQSRLILQPLVGFSLAGGSGSGTGITDGDKGEITVTDDGATWTIDNGVISNAKLATNAVDSTKAANLSPNDLAQTGASTNDVLTWTGDKYAPRAASGSIPSIIARSDSTVVVRNGQLYYKNNPRIFNVKDFGALGDNSNDDTQEIQAAINAAYAAGGGTVYFPSGIYRIAGAIQTDDGNGNNPNSQLYVPGNFYTASLRTVKFLGEQPPNLTATVLVTGVSPIRTGAILYSTVAGSSMSSILGTKGPASGFGFLNYTTIHIENLTFRVAANVSASGPTMSGINARYFSAAVLKNVRVDIDTSFFNSVLPVAETFGIWMPGINNDVVSICENTLAGGFRYGYVVAEHFNGLDINAQGCYHGIVLEGSAHAIHIDRAGIQWCAYLLSAGVGSVPSPINSYITINQLDSEWKSTGWFANVNTIYDPSNRLYGEVRYHIVEAFVGTNNARFSKNGGANIAAYPTGATNGIIYHFFRDGGVSHGNNTTIGTNDNFSLTVETNNTPRAIYGNDGSWRLIPNATARYLFPSTGLSDGSWTSNLALGALNTAESLGENFALSASNIWLRPIGTTTGVLIARETTGVIPNALLQLGAGSTVRAPLKFTSGTNRTTAEAGAIEYDGTEFYATNSTASRTTLARVLKGSNTLDFGSTAAGAVTDLTITVTGAADGDVVSLSVPNASQTTTGSFSAWVSATNTVTVRYRIAALVGSEDPASGTFKVTVTK